MEAGLVEPNIKNGALTGGRSEVYRFVAKRSAFLPDFFSFRFKTGSIDKNPDWVNNKTHDDF